MSASAALTSLSPGLPAFSSLVFLHTSPETRNHDRRGQGQSALGWRMIPEEAMGDDGSEMGWGDDQGWKIEGG